MFSVICASSIYLRSIASTQPRGIPFITKTPKVRKFIEEVYDKVIQKSLFLAEMSSNINLVASNEFFEW